MNRRTNYIIRILAVSMAGAAAVGIGFATNYHPARVNGITPAPITSAR